MDECSTPLILDDNNCKLMCISGQNGRLFVLPSLDGVG